MDLISQLQDHTNHIAFILFDTIGALQRDAQPSPIPGKKLPDPPPPQADGPQSTAGPNAAATTPAPAAAATPAAAPGSTKPGAAEATPAGTVGMPAGGGPLLTQPDPAQAAASLADDVSARAAALVKALKLFDDMVAALPEEVDASEEEILKKIGEVHAENEKVGLELAQELEAAEVARRNVAGLFSNVAAHVLNEK